MKKNVAILGSTGSIGTQALDVIDKNPAIFNVEVLTARNSSKLLIDQARKFKPSYVVITAEEKYCEVCDALEHLPIQILTGEEALKEVVCIDKVDIVLSALVGYSGLFPTISAIEAGKNIALANKETLVVAGELITSLARTRRVDIYPVDSEHSAIFQCLAGEAHNPIEKIYLTASGGPFRKKSFEELKSVTPKEALKHPNWDMGNKVTIDSASLMNKGLEAIEAKWLFGLTPEQIDVIVHPQSIIHSIVQFADSSMKAQMGLPDMRLPIQYALGFPSRLKADFPRFNFLEYPELSFEKPDAQKFKNLSLAFEAMKTGGNMPCILNAANEIAVDAFLNNKLGFLDMPVLIEKTMSKINFINHPSLDDYAATDAESRQYAKTLLSR
ncbi:MAG: 1-deoxy-D-xylulose-5-phosphate reductoisomerase [Bacteroidales bacterium]|nr:1-deoxy-D-xylulose-5-phosphate reductoisomerase [Bacteroidales bacterium]MBN2817574.1 1-deoxy-D-xylulose-5-phosphate reductoisomerase [Bacteroidales bacterium]